VLRHVSHVLIFTLCTMVCYVCYLSQLFPRIVVNGSFWLGLLLLWAMVGVKDLYLLALKYHGFPSDAQILREVPIPIPIPTLILTTLIAYTYSL
jgi:hypothetical protein